MEAITLSLASAFPQTEKGAGDHLCIIPGELFFPEAPCLPAGGEEGLISFRDRP